MVCSRCKMFVKQELHQLGLQNVTVELGIVEIIDDFTTGQREQLRTNLLRWDLELIDDKKSILIKRIKTVIIEMIHYSDELPPVNYSQIISERLNRDYTYLANIFSEVTGNTIQHFIIQHKIEKVKELLMYGELTLSQIANQLHYSSVPYLSKQFHQITGISPSDYKRLNQKHRNNLENV